MWKLIFNKTLKAIIAPLLSLAIILLALISIVNQDIPKIGHDYGYHLPRMLDGFLHQKLNGLEIQWYTPSFGGGLPAYPNPQDIQYSLPQLLMHVFNPWTSLMISLSSYSALGFLSFYLLLKEVCGFSKHSSLIGAVFILANGFLVQHVVVGHVGFQVFPLLGTILYVLFSRKFEHIHAGILIGIVSFVIINQSGFYIAFIFSLSLAIMLPLMYLTLPLLFDWRRISSVAFWSGLLALSFSASKLIAVYSFMRFFPREINDIYDQTYLLGISGLGLQLLGGMIIIPYLALTGRDLNDLHIIFQNATKSTSNIWETDISISPVLILILIYGGLHGLKNFIKRKDERKIVPSRFIATLLLILGTWLVVDFSLAKGWLFELLKPLPIINSLHVNVRFASAFIFPMAFAGAYVLNRHIKIINVKSNIFYGLLGLLTLLFLLLYLLPSENVFRKSSHINQPLAIYAQIEDGEKFPINTIQNLKDINVFKKQASNLKNIFEPIFGYDLEYFNPLVYPGLVFEMENGYYNMTNPASYVFPAENGLTSFERFRIDQEVELVLFVNRQQPRLNISTSQGIANGISMVSMFGAAVFLVLRFFYRLVKAKKSINST